MDMPREKGILEDLPLRKKVLFVLVAIIVLALLALALVGLINLLDLDVLPVY